MSLLHFHFYQKMTLKNFINEDLVLLEEEVYFESSDFKIYSDKVTFKRGGKVIIFLGLFTIFSAVNFHNTLHLPPMLGLMFGLGLLGLYSFYLKITFNPEYE